MSIEDSNPERRNLAVMSMSIIVFYIGGGSVDGAEGLSLPLVTLHFKNPELLGCLAWIALFWFAFRYFVEYKYVIWNTAFSHIDNESISAGYIHDYLKEKYIIKKLKIGDDTKLVGWAFQAPSQADTRVRKFNPKLKYVKLVSSKSFVGENNIKISPVDERDAAILFISCLLQHFLSNKDISAFFGPVILFVVAVGIGLSAAY